jgi:hypothetical protein
MDEEDRLVKEYVDEENKILSKIQEKLLKRTNARAEQRKLRREIKQSKNSEHYRGTWPQKLRIDNLKHKIDVLEDTVESVNKELTELRKERRKLPTRFSSLASFSPTSRKLPGTKPRKRKPKSKSRRKPTSKSKSRKHKPKSKSRKHKPKSKSRKPKSRSRRRR